MSEHDERMKRFEAWLPQFEARLRENRRRSKQYAAIIKLRRLLKSPSGPAGQP